jgi:hypothetical protein
MTANESIYSRKTIVLPAKVNFRSSNVADLSKKLMKIASKEDVQARQYDSVKAVGPVARKRHVGTFYIGHEG